MEILHVAKNIPSPYKKENDIILELDRVLAEGGSYKSCFIYPLEMMPSFVRYFKIKSPRVRELLFVKNYFIYNNKTINVIRYYRLPFRYFSNAITKYFFCIAGNKSLIDKISSCKYDVIHAHHVVPDGVISCYKGYRSCRFVVTVRQGDVDKISSLPRFTPEYAIYRKVITSFDRVIVHGHAVEKFIKDEFNVTSFVVPHAAEEPSRAKSFVAHSNYVFCSSRLIPRKNIDWVISAFESYLSHGEKKIKLLISGEGSQSAELRKRAGSNVEFLGQVEKNHNIELIANAALFLLPSSNETFGRVYVEALSVGTPSIALKNTGLYGYDVGDAIEFVDNYQQFEVALHRLLNDTEELCRRSKESLVVFRKNFTWAVVREKYREIYEGE